MSKANLRTTTISLAVSILIFICTAPFAQAIAFTDVQPGSKFYDEINWAVDNGITLGLTETEFGPNATCNNGQIITYLWRAFGKPMPVIDNPFPNMTTANYYYNPVIWAYEKGIIPADSSFNPAADCTRLATVTYLWKAAGCPAPTSDAYFSDVPSITNAISWAVQEDITTGYTDGTFRPLATCTRAQIITFLYRSFVLSPNPMSGKAPISPAITPSGTNSIPANGRYKLTTADGTYEVIMKNGVVDGDSPITFTNKKGDVYSGKVVGNAFSGQCSITYANGDRYFGDVYNNQKNGSGQYFWASGDSYVGIWESDSMKYGTYNYTSGEKLNITFSNGLPHGSGTFTDVNGIQYAVSFTYGVMTSMERS